MTWQRARSEEQKDERLRQITDAAEKLFQKKNYAEITLKDIAEQLSFTRANLYKYAKTKEEIFLMVFQKHISHWVKATHKAIPADVLPLTDEEFAKRWSKTLAQEKTLLRVRPLLNALIEENVRTELFVEFKSAIWHDSFDLLPLLQKELPFLDKAAAKHLFKVQLLYAGAAYAAAETTEKHWKLLKACDPELVHTDFQTEFEGFLLSQMAGLRILNKQ